MGRSRTVLTKNKSFIVCDTSPTAPRPIKIPIKTPRTAPINPMINASLTTIRNISWRVTPILRKVPKSGRRWTTEKVIVLYIRNKATTSANKLSAVRFKRKAAVICSTAPLRTAFGSTRIPLGSISWNHSRLASSFSGRMRSIRSTCPSLPVISWAVAISTSSRPSIACRVRLSAGSSKPATETFMIRPAYSISNTSPKSKLCFAASCSESRTLLGRVKKVVSPSMGTPSPSPR